jgi:hypothetical protein
LPECVRRKRASAGFADARQTQVNPVRSIATAPTFYTPQNVNFVWQTKPKMHEFLLHVKDAN